MRILVVAPEIPYPPTGGSLMRTYQFTKRLAARHGVTLLTYSGPGTADRSAALAAIGIDVRTVPYPVSAGKRMSQLAAVFSARSYRSTMYHRPAMQRIIEALLDEIAFDAVLLESSLMGRFDFRETPVVLDEHNLEYEMPERAARTERSPIRKGFAYLEQRKLKQEAKSLWQRVSRCVTTSERERMVVCRETRTGTTATVPNGVDLEYFQPGVGPLDAGSIVFTGRISYRPNTDAICYFVQEILPLIHASRPDVRLTVVGMDVPPAVERLAGPRVAITGTVPDVRPYLRQAAAVVVPIRFGGGTRLKVLEALAMGKPLVSTSIGCEGIDVVPGQHLLIGDSAADFAAAVLNLLAHPELGVMLGKRGRALVEERYGWPRLSSILESVLETAAASGSRSGGAERRSSAMAPKQRA
jgi:sugar transferase (PEP-CTERM/EpsH1 system associated)